MDRWKRGMEKLRFAYYRMYSDFLMPSRLALYERLLQTAIEQGYEVHSVSSFWELVKAGGPKEGKRYLILRHDVDTDVKTAGEMWQIERKWGVKASYYFRLSTLDLPLMQKIHQSGSEASYHYEELATIGKRMGLKTRQQIGEWMPLIRRQFAENVKKIRDASGLPIQTVASHGDFYNRRTGVINCEILRDDELRKKLGIELETYDEEMMRHVTARHSDKMAPDFWKPQDPMLSLLNGERVVYVLTHPRHWRTDRLGNLADNVGRLWEEVCFQVRSRRKSSPPDSRLLLPLMFMEGEWTEVLPWTATLLSL